MKLPGAPRGTAVAVVGVAGALIAISAVLFALRPDYVSARAGQLDAGYLGSNDCRKCHQLQYDTWRATFHRTMTREATPENVLGDFHRDNALSYHGVEAEMIREGEKFSMRLTDAQGRKQTLAIVRTVGSRRIQQYLTGDGDRLMRLPVAYDLVNRRWMHLNGSFFRADGGAYDQPVAEWNSNCVFCHNVKAQPGFDWDRKTWNTEVAELGVACGACHGPAAAHAQAATFPLTRYRWHLGDSSAPPVAVTHPAKLDSDRSAMICGHCHGQRIPEPESRIREVLSKGDPFDAGKDLKEFYKPVQRETKVGHFSFATRFWADGSPRLTAYEYQGMLRSKCSTSGKPGDRITCTSCHSMHDGDPRGQLTEGKKTNAACNQCHQPYAAPTALAAHTKHPVESAGSLCFNCHMPRIVYGVMAAHRTHDITIPRPVETVEMAKPNACNLCHADRSANWAIAETKRLWPKAFTASQPVDARFEEPEGRRALFAEDAVVRALTAAALSPARDWSAPWLLEAMNDRYPIVRYFAANGLAAARPDLPKPDYLTDAPTRAGTLTKWVTQWPESARDEARQARERLEAGRLEVDVEVGE